MVLHLLGLDHKKLTYYYNGLERRLTDVHGHVIRDVVDARGRRVPSSSSVILRLESGRGLREADV